MGERFAAEELQKLGFECCAMNMRLGSDEADIVMRDPDGVTLVVVEVKTRSRSGVFPEERVDYAKQRTLMRFARALAARSPTPCPIRIDVVAVSMPPGGTNSMRRFENAVIP